MYVLILLELCFGGYRDDLAIRGTAHNQNINNCDFPPKSMSGGKLQT